MSDTRDRTGVPLPDNYRFGYTGQMGLAILIPLGGSASAAPWSPLGENTMFLGMALLVPVIFGMPAFLNVGSKLRRAWWVRWYTRFGRFLLVLYALTLLMALACLLGILPRTNGPDTIALSVVGTIMLVAFGLPCVAMLVYGLRSPYWDMSAPREVWAAAAGRGDRPPETEAEWKAEERKLKWGRIALIVFTCAILFRLALFLLML